MSDADTIRRYVTMTYPSVEERNQMYAALNALLAENQRLRDALEAADDLLRRLSEWDMLYIGPPPITADGPYWQGEIRRTREALAGDAE